MQIMQNQAANRSMLHKNSAFHLCKKLSLKSPITYLYNFSLQDFLIYVKEILQVHAQQTTRTLWINEKKIKQFDTSAYLSISQNGSAKINFTYTFLQKEEILNFHTVHCRQKSFLLQCVMATNSSWRHRNGYCTEKAMCFQSLSFKATVKVLKIIVYIVI